LGEDRRVKPRQPRHLAPYTIGTVTSRDGTSIAFRRLGRGPGVVLVHGAMQAAQNFMRLASALAGSFTVHVPDRRGRGASGAFGPDYGVARECEDLQALLAATDARDVFGLSSGALIVMQAARTVPLIRKIALYEPPFPVGDGRPGRWLGRFDGEVARGDLAAALVTVIQATGDDTLFTHLPRFVLTPLVRLGVRANARRAAGDDTPIAALIPTAHYDAQLAASFEGTLDEFRDLRNDVLLLGGSRSQRFLRTALDAIAAVLPRARRVELPGVGHVAADNGGKPELVAEELRRFFAGAPSPG
jgi:alpha-beta hydrolase superfamily lysophospholipase